MFDGCFSFHQTMVETETKHTKNEWKIKNEETLKWEQTLNCLSDMGVAGLRRGHIFNLVLHSKMMNRSFGVAFIDLFCRSWGQSKTSGQFNFLSEILYLYHFSSSFYLCAVLCCAMAFISRHIVFAFGKMGARSLSFIHSLVHLPARSLAHSSDIWSHPMQSHL